MYLSSSSPQPLSRIFCLICLLPSPFSSPSSVFASISFSQSFHPFPSSRHEEDGESLFRKEEHYRDVKRCTDGWSHFGSFSYFGKRIGDSTRRLETFGERFILFFPFFLFLFCSCSYFLFLFIFLFPCLLLLPSSLFFFFFPLFYFLAFSSGYAPALASTTATVPTTPAAPIAQKTIILPLLPLSSIPTPHSSSCSSEQQLTHPPVATRRAFGSDGASGTIATFLGQNSTTAATFFGDAEFSRRHSSSRQGTPDIDQLKKEAEGEGGEEEEEEKEGVPYFKSLKKARPLSHEQVIWHRTIRNNSLKRITDKPIEIDFDADWTWTMYFL
jgi:hypothetical protein